MTIDPEALIDGYLDETLSPDEHATLEVWLKESSDHARRFAQSVLLHDRMRGELVALASLPPDAPAAVVGRPLQPGVDRSRASLRSLTAFIGLAISAGVLLFVFWKGLGDSPVSAAVVELNRLIAVSDKLLDRTYQITVEEVALSPPGDRADRGRPSKPPMDGAVLHVRGGSQFVLIRRTNEGMPFVTGCDGTLSWAVRPGAPVRVSSDLTRFNRDLPGHEHGMPLINIHDGLERLRAAYDVRLLPIEEAEDEASRLLVAVKKSGFRGPRRVEITYAVASGQIRQLRFVEMPYGPDRLTLRMTLSATQVLAPEFFHHEAHHGPEREIEQE